MSSKTLALSAHAGRTTGAVIESSIGSLRVAHVFDFPGAGSALPGGPFDRVVATLEPSAAAFRVLELPFRDRRRVAQAVGPALEEHVPYALDDGSVAWDYAAPNGAGPGASVLAAIAETGRLEAARARLLELGAVPAPHRLIWEPTAILTAYRRSVGEDQDFVAVDFGDGGAVIARIESGCVSALRVVAPCDDALMLRNVAWSLATVAGEQDRAVVGGPGAGRLLGELARRVPGMRFEPLPAAAPVDGFGARDWRETTALAGLVLVASGDSLAPTLDFEAGSGSLFGLSSLRDLQGEAAPLVRWAALAATLAIVAVGIDYVQLFRERSLLAARAEQAYASAMPSGSGGAGRKLKMEMRLRELSGRAGSATGGAGSPLELLAALSREIPKNLEVVVDQVEHVPPAAKVTGHAETFETVTKMQEELRRGGSFSRVDVKDVHAAVTGGGVEFLLELETATPGAGA